MAPMILAFVLLTNEARGQDVVSPDDVEAGLISLNFPENLELKVLVEYVSHRLGINIIYDEQVGNRRVTIKAPERIPAGSLLGLLESSLRMKGLALIDGDQPGWKRVVPAANLVAIARSPEETAALLPGPSQVLTHVFSVRHTDVKRIDLVIKPFLTQPGANSMMVPEAGLLIVTDYASNMHRIGKLIGMIDQPTEPIAVEFVQAKHQEASQLAQHALKLIRAKLTAESRTKGVTAQGVERIDITHDDRTNQVVIVGVRDRVQEALEIIGALDVALGLKTRVYQFKVASPERVDRLTKELIGPLDAKRLYRSAVDQEAGLLVVATTHEIHHRIESLRLDLDVPVPESQSPIRVYRLVNATASEVLETIRALESDKGLENIRLGGSRGDQQASGPFDARGPNRPPAALGEPLPTPPAFESNTAPTVETDRNDVLEPIQHTVRTNQVTVTADANTNSIIVVASPEVQPIYEKLIRMLDRRRPQVLIEMKIVTVDTSDDFSLGVEISREGSSGDSGILSFSSFGLSTVDAATGGLSLIPGLGFNGALINSDIADIVLRALSTDMRSRVVSAPRILVNDNATGTLSSVAEEPFTSVNASDTVATTSFAGFVEAGTTVTVTPHISEDDHLNLEYSISLNSFTGAGATGVPPPRKTDSIESVVTVPDGYTVIVGGLNRKDYSKTVNAVPLLGQIPILKYLFSNETKRESNTTLFVFIRPIILRDDQFKGLKFLSHREITAAGIPADFPVSEPLLMN